MPVSARKIEMNTQVRGFVSSLTGTTAIAYPAFISTSSSTRDIIGARGAKPPMANTSMVATAINS